MEQPKQWKSLTELERDGALPASDEFPTHGGETSDPLSRRNFFQLMGASMALAGVAGPGCKRYEKEFIVPLARRPEDQVPGTTQRYASAFDLAGATEPLVVTTYEGRPIKIGGNDTHPFAAGGVNSATKSHAGTSAFAQASVLNLYDPDRSNSARNAGKGATLGDFKLWLGENRAALMAGGAKVRVLAEASSSPTVAAMKKQLTEQMVGAIWHEYEPLSLDNERMGTKLAFGRPLRAMLHLDKAKSIITLDADLFGEHPASVRYSRDFARSRNPDNSSLGNGQMNRLWSVESAFTNTGAMADHRLALRSELVLPFLMALDALLIGGSAPNAGFLKEQKVSQFLTVLVEELREQRGHAVLAAGRRQSPDVHALVAKINAAIAAPGATLSYFEDPEPDRVSHAQSIAQLVADIGTGQVETLLILGGNPVYNAPVDLDFAAALAKVKTSIHLSEYFDETSSKTTWHVPRANYLEAWGDARTWDGTYTLAQPMIQPLYSGLSVAEFISLMLGKEEGGMALVQTTFVAIAGPLGTWRQAIHDGFVGGTAYAHVQDASVVAFAPAPLTETQLADSVLAGGKVEVTFVASSNTYDGRFANNGWLQESPDFLTKVTWDNYALVGPSTAKELGIKNDTLIKVTVDGRELEIAAYTMPGQARSSIALVLGGGRTMAGVVGGNGKKAVGFNTYALRASNALNTVVGASVTATGKAFELANVQEHWDLRNGFDDARGKKMGEDIGVAQFVPDLAREATLAEFQKPDYSAEHDVGYFSHPDRGTSPFSEHQYEGYAWGMSVDLNTCTGCNACVIACQSENNVPVVGKDQVKRDREMHWFRIDRYFQGPADDPQIVHQPLGCQHCENAPCEQVCPVGATIHSDEGLNDMSYNRCVGTRYCMNNCTYRVRRFNYLEWHKEFQEARNNVRKLLFNPEVTVRSRGVMEKCTYCVQRIQAAKITSKNARRKVQDGDIVTACQAACPSESIVFGDINDKASRVSKLIADRRAYELLGHMNNKPRTRYLARLRNPHPKLAAAASGAAGHAPAAHH
ncbi:MAG: Fe-S-cluster-containing hydrogenase [Myxococcales bacterium]|nr:Fe-S-cluster-containing hydrogenase [Myxococcales bacterium]